MAEIVCLRTAEDRRDHIHRSVQRLSSGELIGLPTETGYVLAAHALQSEAVHRLARVVPGEAVLVCRSTDEALDYLPDLPRVGLKLARRGWPGPLQLVVSPEVVERGLFAALPGPTQSALLATRLRVRVSAEEVLNEVARFLPGPLVISDETAGAPMQSATELARATQDSAELVLDAGPVRYSDGPTVVEIAADRFSVLRTGAISGDSIRTMSSDIFLFVCTGNTCRSPMAEALFRHKLAQRLGCQEADLPQHGFCAASAGLSAGYGMPASPEAVDLMQQCGADLNSHSSQPLTDRLLEQADFIYTMTRGHRRAILAERPELSDRVQLLAADGSDVPDPIGAGFDEYERCQRVIDQHLDAILDRLQIRPSGSSPRVEG